MSNVRPMRLKALAILTFVSVSAHAADRIVPTSDQGSDCVAARITANKTSLNQKYDQLYCSINKESAAYTNCLRNVSSINTVDFFTDRCNEASDGAYVSFNGKTYQVWRASPAGKSSVTYAGTYMGETLKGENLEVRVVPRKILSRHYDGYDLLGVTASVDVTIKYGGQSSSVRATYVSGP